jgi:hypothetical protein
MLMNSWQKDKKLDAKGVVNESSKKGSPGYIIVKLTILFDKFLDDNGYKV